MNSLISGVFDLTTDGYTCRCLDVSELSLHIRRSRKQNKMRNFKKEKSEKLHGT
jgi:hypothetical protein